jgi:hypothetical protein
VISLNADGGLDLAQKRRIGRSDNVSLVCVPEVAAKPSSSISLRPEVS